MKKINWEKKDIIKGVAAIMEHNDKQAKRASGQSIKNRN